MKVIIDNVFIWKEGVFKMKISIILKWDDSKYY